VTVGGGSWKEEVRWSISCGDREYVSEEDGRAPYEERVGLPACTECVLAMRDTAGDGWSSNYFSGFGLRETMDGRSKSKQFTTECPVANVTSPNNASSGNDTDTRLVTVGGGTYTNEVRWSINCNEVIYPVNEV